MDQARIRRPADWNTGNLSPSSAPPCGITPQELDSIRLYAGAPIPGRIERFYRLPNAYQTFNLLMMAGLEGSASAWRGRSRTPSTSESGGARSTCSPIFFVPSAATAPFSPGRAAPFPLCSGRTGG